MRQWCNNVLVFETDHVSLGSRLCEPPETVARLPGWLISWMRPND